jgi:integrase
MFERSRSTRWRETSKYAFDYYKGKLLAEFGSVPLKAMNDADMQKFLNRLRDEKYSKSVVEHCMKYLKAILEDAVDEDVLGKNPARKLRLPDGLPEEDTPYLPITDYLKLLKELPTKRDQIMAGLLYMGGLRRGELFGLRWQDYDGGTVAVERQINRFYKEADPKTKSSRAKIVIPPALRSDLDGWRQWCPDSSPTAYIFPSKSGSAIHFKNWADRVLKPAAKRAKLERISYHMFRRGLATEAHQSGEVDKNIQAQMRHASPDETRNTYMKHVPDAHKVSMTRLEETVNGKATEAAAKLSQATAPSDTNTDGPKAA